MNDGNQGHGGGPQPQEAQAAQSTKKLKILVTKTGSGSGKEILCSIAADDHGTDPYVENGRIKLWGGQGPFQIEFRLDSQSGLEWDPEDPFDTKKNSCPGKGENENEQVFLQKPNGRVVSIVNLNWGQPCEVHYRMNFKDGYYCDPIMDNGGG